MKTTPKKNGGFTLVELIVVIAILAILAAVAIGIYPDLDTAAKGNTGARSCIPDPGNAEIYDGLYRRYLRVLEATKALYD